MASSMLLWLALAKLAEYGGEANVNRIAWMSPFHGLKRTSDLKLTLALAYFTLLSELNFTLYSVLLR